MPVNTRADAREAVSEASRRRPVSTSSSAPDAQGEWVVAASRMIRRKSQSAGGEQFLSATDMRGDGSVAAAWTVAGCPGGGRQTILDVAPAAGKGEHDLDERQRGQ